MTLEDMHHRLKLNLILQEKRLDLEKLINRITSMEDMTEFGNNVDYFIKDFYNNIDIISYNDKIKIDYTECDIVRNEIDMYLPALDNKLTKTEAKLAILELLKRFDNVLLQLIKSELNIIKAFNLTKIKFDINTKINNTSKDIEYLFNAIHNTTRTDFEKEKFNLLLKEFYNTDDVIDFIINMEDNSIYKLIEKYHLVSLSSENTELDFNSNNIFFSNRVFKVLKEKIEKSMLQNAINKIEISPNKIITIANSGWVLVNDNDVQINNVLIYINEYNKENKRKEDNNVDIMELKKNVNLYLNNKLDKIKQSLEKNDIDNNAVDIILDSIDNKHLAMLLTFYYYNALNLMYFYFTTQLEIPVVFINNIVKYLLEKIFDIKE